MALMGDTSCQILRYDRTLYLTTTFFLNRLLL